MARSSSPMPHACRMRPTSWSKWTARGSRYGVGHCSSTSTVRPRWPSRMARTRPTGPAPTLVTSVLTSRPQRLVAPRADGVVAPVLGPVVADDPSAVADLDLEAGRGLQVEAEHPVVGVL